MGSLFYLENPIDRGDWWARVHGVVKSQTRLKPLSMHMKAHFQILILMGQMALNILIFILDLFCLYKLSSTITGIPSILTLLLLLLSRFSRVLLCALGIQYSNISYIYSSWWVRLFSQPLEICPQLHLLSLLLSEKLAHKSTSCHQSQIQRKRHPQGFQ